MESQLQLTAVIERENNGYVSVCPELDVASRGDTIEEAAANLIQALQSYFSAAGTRTADARCPGEVQITRVEIVGGYAPGPRRTGGGRRPRRLRVRNRAPDEFACRSPSPRTDSATM